MTKKIFTIIILSFSITFAQYVKNQEPLAHTYSIVAFDQNTGEMGVAVQSHWFSVGPTVIWGEAGVGVVATQSFINPEYGSRGLALMKQGLEAKQVLQLLIDQDKGRDLRQVAMLDNQGNIAAYTGKNCIDYANHIVGRDYSVQANMMLNQTVPKAMASAFERTSGALEDKLMAALEAAEMEDGDIRGKQSAAILVVNSKNTDKPWVDRKIDLRVEDHQTPIKELKRLLKIHKAYEHMNKGDLAIENNNMGLAMEEYQSAQKLFPENEEMKYWHAITLANTGNLDEALKMFKDIFSKNPNWAELTSRLYKARILNIRQDDLNKILQQKGF
ncbi:MAG: Zn-dependent protease [Ignavibacteriae bacterium]|nr:MAG: Zn-dependent protease [Ignavibacteriota bacterium]